jgi:hypothetical protein
MSLAAHSLRAKPTPTTSMSTAPSSAREALTLVAVAAGDRVRVERIHFADAIQRHCSAVQVNVGDILRCVRCSSLHIVVTVGTGRHEAVDRFYACFVEVSRLPVVPGAESTPCS